MFAIYLNITSRVFFNEIFLLLTFHETLLYFGFNFFLYN